MKQSLSKLIVFAVVLTLFTSCTKIEKPLTASELLNLGEKYLLEMDYEQAIVYFNKLIEVEPMYPRGYTGAAEVYIALGETEKAESILQQGLATIPDNTEIVQMIAENASHISEADIPFEDGRGTASITEEGDAAALEGVGLVSSMSVQVGDIIQLGKQNNKAIDWRVLDVHNDKILLLSDKVLEEMWYHTDSLDSTWESCSIRKYLNGTFYDDAFTTDEKTKIFSNTILNKDNPWVGISSGNDTTDKVFLLSLEEVVHYFGDSGQLTNSLRDILSDQYDDDRIAYDETGNASIWWLRTKGRGALFQGVLYGSTVYVSRAGYICVEGSDGGDGETIAGVRPALWITLE